MDKTKCFHCGDSCIAPIIVHREKSFCCHGCKMVFDILSDHDLSYYYDLEAAPGSSPKEVEGKFNFLDTPEIAAKLLTFSEGDIQIASFLIPSIHCSSCIWVLENLHKLNGGVVNSEVNFPEKTLQITFSSKQLSLRDLVVLLARIGYEPYISLEDGQTKKRAPQKTLIYKLGVAGFAFGNVMFLSFPEYFEESEFWLNQFKHLFRWLMFAFSIPVVVYAAQDYFRSAYKGLKARILNIDVPIVIGIAVLFIRSTIDIAFNWGSGFFDSLTGLIFFLLLGKFFQQKTYAYLSFERDYKSYFPMAVTQLVKAERGVIVEKATEVHQVKRGDRLLIRNNELIPMDAILIKGKASIDYSFVTGEAVPVSKFSGETLFAGGKQQGGTLEIEVIKPVSQSYLTQLWSNDIFSKKGERIFRSITDQISKNFTLAVLSIAGISTLFWLLVDPSKAFNVFTAVLIVACPCAIALASPFTLGGILRYFGKVKLYLKEAGVIEQMAHIDTIVFDKTGTLTSSKRSIAKYEGVQLSEEEKELLTTSLRASNHPLSRALYRQLARHSIKTVDEFEERSGNGFKAKVANDYIKIGSYHYVVEANSEDWKDTTGMNQTAVHFSRNGDYKGCFIFHNQYRLGVDAMMNNLKANYRLIVLSGDNSGERDYLKKLMPSGTELHFNQKPDDKMNFIGALQHKGHKVLMIGDGLNDAGALKQSDVGIAVSEDTNVFSPACDGIMDAHMLHYLPEFLMASKKGLRVIKWSFLFSLFYNITGLVFAVTGHLKPVIAAILMPLSSISIVIFTSLMVRFYISKTLPNAKS